MAKKKNTVEYYYNAEGQYIYSGTMKEGDRVATDAEVTYWSANGSTIQKDNADKNTENTTKYTEALNSPLACGEYYVIADWINTYTNTYTYAKKSEENGANPQADIVAFNAEGKLVTITISSVEDFEPFYNVVADEWARITDLRNKYMVEIQNSSAPKEIEINYAKA